jgi:hypothetical protein
MPDPKQELIELHRKLGFKALNPVWAKLEILLGLGAAGAGLLLPFLFASSPSDQPFYALPGLILFVLGGYLAMAGHRSHLYQSNNALTAYLLSEIRPLHSKG